MLARLHDLRRRLGVDRAVFFAAGTRAWQLVAGVITIWIVGTRFSKEALGYYGTFLGVMGFQILLELGLSQSLLQFASHEFAKLSFNTKGRLEGDAQALQRLSSLGKLALRWYGGLALVVLVVVGLGGHVFFATKPDIGINWMAPWWLFCAMSAINLSLMPILFLLEGCNQVASVNAFRLTAGVACNLVGWTAILSGANLFACGLMTGTLVLVGIAYLAWCWPGFIRDLFAAAAPSARGWLDEIWPFQWRYAISAVSGFFLFLILTPMMMSLQGAAVAGQVWLTLQAINGLSSFAAAWTQTKAPLYGMLISQRQFTRLDRVFWWSTLQSVLIACAGSVALLMVAAWLKAPHRLGQGFLELPSLEFLRRNLDRLGERLLDLPSVGLLCLSVVLGQIIVSMAVYLRSHKREPLMPMSVASAIAVTGGAYWLGGKYGGWGVALVYALTQGLIGLPLCSYIFVRKRAEWHRDS